MFFNSCYTLFRSRHIFYQANRLYKKKWHTLSPTQLEELELHLEKMDQAIESSNRSLAHEQAIHLEQFIKKNSHNTYFEIAKEVFLTIAIALFFAIVFRQMIFEPYEIPTGSMRPTFLEGDKIITSKTTYGLNIPCYPQQLYFDSSTVKRNDCVVFTSENLDIPDNDTKYFYLFPAKKRLVKRCIGLPGDTLYFYGGKVFGIDKNGQEIKELEQFHALTNIHHIPYITYEGLPEIEPEESSLIFKQMGLPIGKVQNFFKPNSKAYVKLNDEWVPENDIAYRDFWGINNYAQARLISPQRFHEKRKEDPSLQADSEASLYLELAHSPTLSITPESLSTRARYITPLLKTEYSYIPLYEKHLKKLMKHMYTVRFFIEKQQAYRYHLETPFKSPDIQQVHLKGVEDGLYEFYYGKAYKIPQGMASFFSGAKREALKASHPIYDLKPSKVLTLFNEGISFGASQNPFRNSRYAFFNNGDLHLLGGKIFDKADPVLQSFVEKEHIKLQQGKLAFLDQGTPFKEGNIDSDYIKKYGYHVPENHYFLLGDNHAQSSDSRDFGAIPSTHLRGSPSFRLWPIDERFGTLPQPEPLLRNLTLIVWSIILSITVLLYSLHFKAIYAARFKKIVR
ncbi:MAG: signal peptidase I [Chlamydiales bacterium]|nr:signal peptidase I [Chlamydiales bacterium]